jgi:hypothetical protein
MFTRPGDGEFPTVADIERSSWSLDLYSIDTEPFASWLAIAFDPRSLRYGDEDAEAMDETNWDALVSDLVGYDRCLGDGDHDGPPHVSPQYHGYRCGEAGYRCQACEVAAVERDEALAAGIAIIGQLLAVDPENLDDVEAMRDASRSLADYPLLDEDAYSAREWDAWCDWAPTAWSDEIREASTELRYSSTPTGWMDEDTAEAFEDTDAETMVAELSRDLHYYGGFSGEYGPPFLELFAARFADLLTMVAR